MRQHSVDPNDAGLEGDSRHQPVLVAAEVEYEPRAECRQGGTLGDVDKHWFRAKFFQQYRLFFRYHAPSRIIVSAWVNDEDTRRAYESADDAYRVFRRMLGTGHPPDSWEALLAEARAEAVRLQQLAQGGAR